MIRSAPFASLLVIAALWSPPAAGAEGGHRAAPHHHRPHHRAGHNGVPRGGGYALRPYSSPVSPTVTCRYPDGTPYDPDIIGGPNHVGAGGPAANLGGFDPCAF